MTISIADPTSADTLPMRVLADFIRTPSVNPGIFEAEIAGRVGEWFKGTDAIVDYIETFPGRPSVVVTIKGTGGGPRLVINGHLDTVPVDDLDRWTVDPFDATVRDGFMYGRGSCDMKAGIAAQAAVGLDLLKRKHKGDLVLQFAVGEESGEPGTLSMLQAGHTGDFGVVTEPTQLEVSVATRGLVMIHIRIAGRSIHGSRGDEGLNPVTRLVGVLTAVGRYRDIVLENKHHLLGSGSCTPTVVRAGVKENAVADYCDLYLDRRLVPGETVEGELERLRAQLEQFRAEDPEFDYELDHLPYPFAPAEIPTDSRLALQLQDTAHRVLGWKPNIIGTSFSCDVRNLVNDAGMEAVTYGPGNVAECHCVDERVEVRQVNDAATVLSALAIDLLEAGEPTT